MPSSRPVRLTRLSSSDIRTKSHLASSNNESPKTSSLPTTPWESADTERNFGKEAHRADGRTSLADRHRPFEHDHHFSDPDVDPRDRRAHFDTPNIDIDSDEEDSIMDPDRPSYMRHADMRSAKPLLLKQDDERGRTRYNHSRHASPLHTPTSAHSTRPSTTFSRRSTMRSRSPDTAVRLAARQKYIYASIFLVVSLVSFTVQTELAAYVQTELKWNKAYCMLYLTHGSWSLLWPAQLLILRVQKWNIPWHTFWRRHVYLLRTTAHMVRSQELDMPRQMSQTSPWPYLIRATAFITSALTIGGLSWYLAVDMTSPSDLTAIYNCSAFFAYAFSVPLLKEPFRWDKSSAVLIAIVGVLVVAYGDSKDPTDGKPHAGPPPGMRFLGNLIIGFGSVLYGLYEVLYKRWACPPDGVSANRGMIFANAFGSCIGIFTLTVLWIPLPLLHWVGWETFELPHGETAFYLWVSVIMNATFAGSFLVLISLTSPVLSSVAALLTIFIVAVTDWLRTGESMSLAAISGGMMIVVAFAMLSWSTWREMTEDADRKAREVSEVDWSESEESDKDDGHYD